MLSSSDIKEVQTMDKVNEGILAGKAIIFLDGFRKALLIGAHGFESRGVEEPETGSKC